MKTMSQWSPLDDRAIDLARALAMDAVQKVGNGHPGTAMSLAPAAYALLQRHRYADLAKQVIHLGRRGTYLYGRVDQAGGTNNLLDDHASRLSQFIIPGSC